MCFSQPDSKWLICSSLDKHIRVFDILTGALVDWIKFNSAPLSVDFSPTGEYLITSHVNQKSVFLWSSKAFFSQVVIEKVPEAPIEIGLPKVNAEEKPKESHKDFYKASGAADEDLDSLKAKSMIQ